MEIKGNVEIQGFTRVCDLDDWAVFVFCDDNELFIKGKEDDFLCVTNLENGIVYDIDDVGWYNRPVREVKAVLTVE